jgi:tetratricopeptide (TPR) repeat protein
MRVLRQVVLPLAAFTLVAVPRPAQGQEEFVGPQPPCEIKAGHFLVTGATNHLRIATEEEHRREGRIQESKRVLYDAILNKGQDDNPGAWYYLGRTYVLDNDAWGADSAFRRVLETNPECGEDIAGWLETLVAPVHAEAVAAWQNGHVDSAAAMFVLVRALSPQDAEIPYLMSMMYSGIGELDSAFKYVQIGNEVAAGDTAFDRRKQQAMLDIARGYEQRAFENPAAMQIIESRTQRDTLVRNIQRDSTTLANLIAQWAGKPLRPDVQQAVARDSAMLEQRLEGARAALPAAMGAMERDSTALAQVLDPAIEAYAVYKQQFPDDWDAQLRLLRRYSLAGYTSQMDVLVTQLASNNAVPLNDLSSAGTALFNDGHPAQAAQMLEGVTRRNPYVRSALYTMCRSYYMLQEQERLKRAATQLLEVDPLNQQNLRMLAAAYDLARNADSTRYWVAQADTGVGWTIRVTQMVTMGPRTVINGTVANISGRDIGPLALEFDFLDEGGAVVATSTVQIPALARAGRHALSAETEQTGAVAWRYRKIE